MTRALLPAGAFTETSVVLVGLSRFETRTACAAPGPSCADGAPRPRGEVPCAPVGRPMGALVRSRVSSPSRSQSVPLTPALGASFLFKVYNRTPSF